MKNADKIQAIDYYKKFGADDKQAEYLWRLHKKRLNLLTKKIEGKERKSQKIRIWKDKVLQLYFKSNGPDLYCYVSGKLFEIFEDYYIADYDADIIKISYPAFDFHHIYNVESYPELMFDPKNCVLIKRDLHKKFHAIYGKENNTKEQLEEFKERYIKGEFNE